jgi:hypothetical protein
MQDITHVSKSLFQLGFWQSAPTATTAESTQTQSELTAGEADATACQLVLKKNFLSDKYSLKQQIVIEHLSFQLYALLGVCVPNSYVIEPAELGTDDYGIASEILTEYADLYDLVGADKVKEISKTESLNDKIKLFENSLSRRGIYFKGRENLLVASIFLNDFDVIGRGYGNVGGIRTISDEQPIIKIDPGNANLTSNDSFKQEVSWDNPLLHSTYSCPIANRETIMGNHHFMEVFASLSADKIKKAVDNVAALSDQTIRDFVNRSLYQLLVGQAFLDTITETLLQRKAHFLSMASSKSLEPRRVAAPEVLVLSESDLSAPIRQINTGKSRPAVVELLKPEPLHIPVDELTAPHQINKGCRA